MKAASLQRKDILIRYTVYFFQVPYKQDICMGGGVELLEMPHVQDIWVVS